MKKVQYSSKFGFITYAMIETRMYIAFATSMVSRFTKNPSSEYFNAINQILQYLARSRKRGITFGRVKKLKLIEYSDFD